MIPSQISHLFRKASLMPSRRKIRNKNLFKISFFSNFPVKGKRQLLQFSPDPGDQFNNQSHIGLLCGFYFQSFDGSAKPADFFSLYNMNSACCRTM